MKKFLKSEGGQSFIASILCIILGLLIGYVVLLFIAPKGAGAAITTIIKNFLIIAFDFSVRTFLSLIIFSHCFLKNFVK